MPDLSMSRKRLGLEKACPQNDLHVAYLKKKETLNIDNREQQQQQKQHYTKNSRMTFCLFLLMSETGDKKKDSATLVQHDHKTADELYRNHDGIYMKKQVNLVPTKVIYSHTPYP